MQALEMPQNEEQAMEAAAAVMALNEERDRGDSRWDWDQGLAENMSKGVAVAELLKQYRHLTK
jgi:hypothetical protein